MSKKATSEVESLFAEGLALHEAGRLADAEKIYCQILAEEPDHFDSLHLLGIIFHQCGNHAEAVSQIDFGLKKNPNNVFALNNRGLALHELKRFAEALTSYDRALALRPDDAGVLSNRGLALHELKRFAEALTSYDRALASATLDCRRRFGQGSSMSGRLEVFPNGRRRTRGTFRSFFDPPSGAVLVLLPSVSRCYDSPPATTTFRLSVKSLAIELGRSGSPASLAFRPFAV